MIRLSQNFERFYEDEADAVSMFAVGVISTGVLVEVVLAVSIGSPISCPWASIVPDAGLGIEIKSVGHFS